MEISRRALLRGVGHAAAFGTLAAALPRQIVAADSTDAAATYSLSMVYQYDRGHKFKADRFRDAHLPLLKGIYGDSVERIELRYAEPPDATAKNPVPPSFVVAAVSIWIRDIAAFGRHTAESGAQIAADLQKVTEGHPIVQYDRTVAGLGSMRAEVTAGSSCQSMYFLDKPDAHFDAGYFVNAYLPKMMDVYGKSVRRVEVIQGAAGQGGAKPLIMAVADVYVADQGAFFAAGRNAGELIKDRPNYTDVFPIVSLSTVYAAG